MLGRWLMHVGLRVMPPGPARYELTRLLLLWGEHAVRQVEEGRRSHV
jgi:hypothetical protein